MSVVWNTPSTTVTTTGNTSSVAHQQNATTVTTGTIGSPTGAAGGDLTGTYPDPTIATGAVTQAKIGSNAVVSSKIAAKAVTLDKLPDQAASTVIGRASLGSGSPEVLTLGPNLVASSLTGELDFASRVARSVMGRSAATNGAVGDIIASADGQVLQRSGGTLSFGAPPAAGTSGQVMYNASGSLAGDSGLTYDAATDTLTVGTAGSGSIVMGNGEFLSNSVDGTVRIGTNGTSASDFAFTVDGTSWGYGVKLGTRRNSDGDTSNSLWFNAPLITTNGLPFSLGTSQWYSLSYQASATRACATVGLLSSANDAFSSMSLVLCENNQKGGANRVPSTAHVDPYLYIYGRGSANAADYVRINHNTTDGYVEAGRGVLRLLGASGVRIDSTTYGIGVAPTAVQTGYTTFTNLTTDRTCDADATSVAELADILGTLIVDLKAKGIIA